MLSNSALKSKRCRQRSIAVALSLCLVLAARGQNAPIITTVAGGVPPDGLPATSNVVYLPGALTVDGAGNLFIVDSGNNRICKVDPQRRMSTVAGIIAPGFSGDQGLATSAMLSFFHPENGGPGGVASDLAGNLYIADQANNRVRRVDVNDTITTVAGTGTAGFGGDNGQASSATLNSPAGLTVDNSGNLFIADLGNNRIRKVDTHGIITTVAGNGTFGFSGDGGPATSASLKFPTGIAVDTNGNLFIADNTNARIRKVNANGIINTVAGDDTIGFSGDGGPATSASLFYPAAVLVDIAGNLLIADTWNHRIRKVDTNGIITTVAGNGVTAFSGDGGPATQASLWFPSGLTVDNTGNVLIADSVNNRIRKVDTNGIITTVSGNGQGELFGDGGPATSALLAEHFFATFGFPAAPAVDRQGNLFIADIENNRIRKVDTKGIITTAPGTSLYLPVAVAVDAGDNLFIASFRQVFKVDTSGNVKTVAGNGGVKPLGDGGPATQAGMVPSGVALDNAGNLFIADILSDRIRKVDNQGIITTVAGNGTVGFSGDGGAATSASLDGVSGVAIDGATDLFITDGNARIRKIDTKGIITTVAGNGTVGYSGDGGPATQASLNGLLGVAVDAAGNLFIAEGFTFDGTANRIRKVDMHGIITTLAGNGNVGFSGDGGPAANARVDDPAGVAVDSLGNVYIHDLVNRRVRRVSVPAFAISANPPSATIRDGQSANFTLMVTPLNGFAGSISFACSGLPSFSFCTFNPSSVTANGSPVNVALTLHTSGPNAALRTPHLQLGGGMIPRPALAMWILSGALGTLALVLAGSRSADRRGRCCLLALLGAMLVVTLPGCGGGSNARLPTSPSQVTPPGVNAVTVTAASSDGSFVNIASINLTVTQ